MEPWIELARETLERVLPPGLPVARPRLRHRRLVRRREPDGAPRRRTAGAPTRSSPAPASGRRCSGRCSRGSTTRRSPSRLPDAGGQCSAAAARRVTRRHRSLGTVPHRSAEARRQTSTGVSPPSWRRTLLRPPVTRDRANGCRLNAPVDATNPLERAPVQGRRHHRADPDADRGRITRRTRAVAQHDDADALDDVVAEAVVGSTRARPAASARSRPSRGSRARARPGSASHS